MGVVIAAKCWDQPGVSTLQLVESLEIAGGCRRNLVERTNTMDLTTVDPVVQ